MVCYLVGKEDDGRPIKGEEGPVLMVRAKGRRGGGGKAKIHHHTPEPNRFAEWTELRCKEEHVVPGKWSRKRTDGVPSEEKALRAITKKMKREGINRIPGGSHREVFIECSEKRGKNRRKDLSK